MDIKLKIMSSDTGSDGPDDSPLSSQYPFEFSSQTGHRMDIRKFIQFAFLENDRSRIFDHEPTVFSSVPKPTVDLRPFGQWNGGFESSN